LPHRHRNQPALSILDKNGAPLSMLTDGDSLRNQDHKPLNPPLSPLLFSPTTLRLRNARLQKATTLAKPICSTLLVFEQE
jgi:hypothetical protein